MELERHNRYPQAGVWFRRFLARPTASHLPVQDVGWRALKHDDLELAEQSAAWLLQNRPGLATAHVLLADVRTAQGRIDDAVAQLEQAARLRPPGIADQLQAVAVLRKAGREDEALTRLEALAEQHGGEPRIAMAQARVLMARGRRPDALEALGETVRNYGGLEEPRLIRIQLLRELGLRLEAERALADCVTLATAPRCRMEAGRSALGRGDAPKAKRWLEESLRQDDKQGDTWALLGMARLLEGDRDGAGQALKRARQLSPAHPDVQGLEQRLGM